MGIVNRKKSLTVNVLVHTLLLIFSEKSLLQTFEKL